MKRISLIATATVGFAVPALAADLPARPVPAPRTVAPIYDWSGSYVGVNGGWSGDTNCWSLTNNGTPVVPAIDVGCSSGNSSVAGGQIGYRWQDSNSVFGLEAQGNWANLKGSNISLNKALVTNQSQVSKFGLFTGQVGYVLNNALLYVKGGAAVAGDKYNGLGTATGIVFDQASETHWGGVVGSGIELGFTRNWSVAVEYDHLFMGNANDTFVSTGLGLNNLVAAGTFDRMVSIRQNVDMLTARVNYRWGGPDILKY